MSLYFNLCVGDERIFGRNQHQNQEIGGGKSKGYVMTGPHLVCVGENSGVLWEHMSVTMQSKLNCVFILISGPGNEGARLVQQVACVS